MPPSEPSHNPEELALIGEPQQVSAEATSEAIRAVRQEVAEAERDQAQLLVGELRSNIEQRKKFAYLLYGQTSAWLIFVGYVVLAEGFGRGWGDYGRFHVESSVVIALLTTSTATVIGSFLIFLNYLFPKGGGAAKRST